MIAVKNGMPVESADSLRHGAVIADARIRAVWRMESLLFGHRDPSFSMAFNPQLGTSANHHKEVE